MFKNLTEWPSRSQNSTYSLINKKNIKQNKKAIQMTSYSCLLRLLCLDHFQLQKLLWLFNVQGWPFQDGRRL